MTRFVRWKDFLPFFRANFYSQLSYIPRHAALSRLRAKTREFHFAEIASRRALPARSSGGERFIIFFLFSPLRKTRRNVYAGSLFSRHFISRALHSDDAWNFFFLFFSVSPRFVRGTIFPSLNERVNLRAAPLCLHITRLCRLSGRERETRDCLSSPL